MYTFWNDLCRLIIRQLYAKISFKATVILIKLYLFAKINLVACLQVKHSQQRHREVSFCVLQIKLHKLVGGGGGRGKDGTEKRRSYNLQSGLLSWWSAGNYRVLHKVKKRTSRGNNSIIEKIILCLFVFLVYRICTLLLKLQNASYTQYKCNRVNS